MVTGTIPGLKNDGADQVIVLLQDRLDSLSDLALTLRHVHGNVTGPDFIAVHTLLDSQMDAVRVMAEETAERIAALGGSPGGTPGALVTRRGREDCSIGRAGAIEHLGALDVVYAGVIEARRAAIEAAGELDPATREMLIGHGGQLEQFHWLVRAHLEQPDDSLRTAGAAAERSAARRATTRPAPASPIDAPGTAEAAWRGWAGLGRLPALDVTSWASAVIVAAHPDDEVLGPGGITAMLAAAGARLRVIAVTDGESSHGHRADRAALARRRAAERLAALHALGAGDAEIIRLGLPDAALDGRDADIAAALDGLVTGFDGGLAPWAQDRHADHEAVGRAVAAISDQLTGRAWFFPVWMWHWARPADPRIPWRNAVRVPLTPAAAARKRAALRCFTSQLEPRPGGRGPVLPAAFIPHFLRDYELLLPAERP